jgi:hypothetical protein
MHPHNLASTNGTTKAVPLEAVRTALMCAQVRRIVRTDSQGKRLVRCAAYTQNPLLNISCLDASRGMRPHPVLRSNFSPMHSGDMWQVLERTRYEHGLAEVRRTWGAGPRAMRAEFSNGVMR